MPYLVIENFAAGLDARRHPMMAPVGSLRRADNAFLTRGGELQKRRAFTPWQLLPPGLTKGLAQAQGLAYVFGSGAPPAMPPFVRYQRLQHPAGLELQDVLSWDVYDGKLYVVARFSDGSIFHFYDGARVTDWYDGRARCSFSVVNGHLADGAAVPPVPASAVNNITIDGVDILGTPIFWQGDAQVTAQALVDQINTFVSGPEYEASRDGVTVNIASTDAGAAANGRAVTINCVDGMVTAPLYTAMAGGGELAAAVAAHTALTVSGGGALSAVLAISGGNATGKITSIKVGAVEILNATITWAASDDAMAAAVAAQINAYASAPNYSAAASGNKVTIAPTVLTDVTSVGLAVTTTVTGVLTVAPNPGVMAFGKITSVKIGTIEALGATVTWAVSDNATATALAAQINAYLSSPNYEATAAGAVVTITASDSGVAANGLDVVTVTTGYIAVAPNPATMTGGASEQFVPGTFVKTVQTKMYSLSGSLMHFSGVEQPTKWTTETVGAGFINMANEDGQSQQLIALERYYNKLAIFSRHNIQIWTVDVDPDKNAQSQVLRNTGLLAANSVEQVGDNDVFYLSDSGVRSLRARDSSTAAAVNDIGVPVDELIVQRVSDIGPAAVSDACSVIDMGGRYWLVLGDLVYVFTQFPGSKVAGWTTFSPGFVISDITVMGNLVTARSGDVLYRYGGDSGELVDMSLCEIDLPLLFMEKPAHFKTFTAIDVVCEGKWRVYAGFEPLRLDAMELIAEIDAPTPSMQRVSLAGYGTHANIRLQSDDGEPARLSSFMLHYELADAG